MSNMIELLSNFPTHLYKYSPLSGERTEWMKELIVNSKIYFTPPKDFNDPLDCKIPPCFDASQLKAETYWRKEIKREYPDIKKKDLKHAVNEHVNSLKTKKGQKEATEAFVASFNDSGISCFSSNHLSMLMWSYYTEGHQGIAVRFTTYRLLQIIEDFEIVPLKIAYEEKFPKVNFYDQHKNENDFFQKILGTKSKAWNHEDEYRLMWAIKNGYLNIPVDAIDGVIMGMEIDEENEKLVTEWVKNRKTKTELLKIEHKPNSFELDCIPIEF